MTTALLIAGAFVLGLIVATGVTAWLITKAFMDNWR